MSVCRSWEAVATAPDVTDVAYNSVNCIETVYISVLDSVF